MATAARGTRAAARRRPPARPRASAVIGGIRWDRVARVSLLLVLGAILLSYVEPGRDYVQAWRLAGQTRAEVQNLRHDNRRLEARARRLQDPETIELKARQAGMGKAGERLYVVRGLPK